MIRATLRLLYVLAWPLVTLLAFGGLMAISPGLRLILNW